MCVSCPSSSHQTATACDMRLVLLARIIRAYGSLAGDLPSTSMTSTRIRDLWGAGSTTARLCI